MFSVRWEDIFPLDFSLLTLHHILLIRIKSHAHCPTIHCLEIITPPFLKLWKGQISEGYDYEAGEGCGYFKDFVPESNMMDAGLATNIVHFSKISSIQFHQTFPVFKVF